MIWYVWWIARAYFTAVIGSAVNEVPSAYQYVVEQATFDAMALSGCNIAMDWTRPCIEVRNRVSTPITFQIVHRVSSQFKLCGFVHCDELNPFSGVKGLVLLVAMTMLVPPILNFVKSKTRRPVEFVRRRVRNRQMKKLGLTNVAG